MSPPGEALGIAVPDEKYKPFSLEMKPGIFFFLQGFIKAQWAFDYLTVICGTPTLRGVLLMSFSLVPHLSLIPVHGLSTAQIFIVTGKSNVLRCHLF